MVVGGVLIPLAFHYHNYICYIIAVAVICVRQIKKTITVSYTLASHIKNYKNN